MDEFPLEFAGRIEVFRDIGFEVVEFFLRSWGRTTRELVSPCLRLFREEMALPASVAGPLDLAPLLRAISALFDMVAYLFSG